jgi:hypothetical protein
MFDRLPETRQSRPQWGVVRRYLVVMIPGAAGLSLVLAPLPLGIVGSFALFGLVIGGLLYPRWQLLVPVAGIVSIIWLPILIRNAAIAIAPAALSFWQPVLIAGAAATLLLGLPREITKLLRYLRHRRHLEAEASAQSLSSGSS